MAGLVYLADTTVFVYQARDAAVQRRFQSLLAQGRLAACQMTALEYLNSAPTPQAYERLWDGFRGMRWADVTTDAMNRALASTGGSRSVASTAVSASPISSLRRLPS